jgi:hypothetical protein
MNDETCTSTESSGRFVAREELSLSALAPNFPEAGIATDVICGSGIPQATVPTRARAHKQGLVPPDVIERFARVRETVFSAIRVKCVQIR